MRCAPSEANISPTTDLPLAIPPVRPTFSKDSSTETPIHDRDTERVSIWILIPAEVAASRMPAPQQRRNDTASLRLCDSVVNGTFIPPKPSRPGGVLRRALYST